MQALINHVVVREQMRLKDHMIAAGVAAVALTPLLRANSLAFLAGSTLIDVDHYWDYLTRNGWQDFSPRRTFAFHDLLFQEARRPGFVGLNLLHTVEVLAFLWWLASRTRSSVVMATLWGMAFHLGLDLFYLQRRGMLFRRAISLVEYVVRWRYLKSRGHQPESPYLRVLAALAKAGDGDTEGTR